jgi:hypothetical protein
MADQNVSILPYPGCVEVCHRVYFRAFTQLQNLRFTGIPGQQQEAAEEHNYVPKERHLC